MEDRIRELEEQIRRADKAYWEENSPEIEDTEYDKLVEELRALDPENELVNAVHASGNLDTSKLVKHPVPMLSLQKAYSLEEVKKWAEKVCRSKEEVIQVMPKYDGMSGRWENGKLTSRGNGEWGQDYSDRAPLVQGLPEASSTPVYGEILITDEDWKSFSNVQTKSGAPFKNQRNAAAGIIGCDDVAFYEKQGKLLTFKRYGELVLECTMAELPEKWESFITQIQATCGCPIDGIVFKVKDQAYWESLGHSSHHPYGSIAFKFTNKAVWTKLIGVTLSMGKGQITAIGQVEPVEISGTTVRNVKLQLTPSAGKDGVPFCLLDGTLQVGDEVEIERAGDIIPHMRAAKPGQNRTRFTITECPFCHGPVEVTKSKVSCLNPKCAEKVKQKLQFAIGVLGFKGVAGSYVDKLYEVLGVDTPYKLLVVSEDQLRSHKEFGGKLVDNFLSEQAKALKSSKAQMLVSMDMEEVGMFVAKKLVESFPWDKVTNGEVTAAELEAIPGIGEKTAAVVEASLREHCQEIKEMASLFSFSSSQELQAAKASASKGVVCFTGKSEFPRKEMQKKAQELGWEVADSMTSEVTLLVCADPNSGSSKLKKAAAKGVRIMSDVDFLAGKA